MGQDLQPRVQATGGLGLFERGDQVGERAVVDAATALRGGNRQADREVCLADAWWPEEDDILAALDEAELVQAFDLLPSQRGLKGEIEVPELFDHRQPAGSHRGLQPPVIPQLNLRREELL